MMIIQCGQVYCNARYAVGGQRQSKVHTVQQRAGIDPVLAIIWKASGRLVIIQSLPHLIDPGIQLVRLTNSGIEVAHRTNGQFKGRLGFSRKASLFQNSGEVAIVINTSRILPSLAKKVWAILSLRLCGGLSLTKRTASLRQMNLAVEGWCASIFKSSTPSS